MAVKICVCPLLMDGAEGVTAMLDKIGVTVNVLVPVSEPFVAEIVVVPLPLPVAKPPEVIEAIPLLEELQVEVLVTSVEELFV